MITPENLLEFLDREFRNRAKETLVCHNLPRQERVEQFLCIPKVSFQSSQIRDGKEEFLFGLSSNPSKFREGDRLILSPYNGNYRGKELRDKGVSFAFVSFQGKKKRITLQSLAKVPANFLQPKMAYTIDTAMAQFFPTYSYTSWGVGLLGSGRTQGDGLVQLLKGHIPKDPGAITAPPPSIPLEKKQEEAYWKAFSQPLSLIQGPPGTGKTYLIAALAQGMIQKGQRVLLSALTHRAINNGLNTILKLNPATPVAKVSNALSAFDLNPLAKLIESKEEKKKFWAEVERSSDGLVAGMTVYGAFRPFAVAMLKNFRRLRSQRPQRPKWLGQKYWKKVADYVSALCKISPWEEPGNFFDVVIFDEASQLLMPHALLAMAHSRRWIFVGDQAQLGPIVSQDNPPPILGRSIFDHLLRLYPQFSTMLEVSFRMNRALIHFPSRVFYQGNIRPSKESANRKFPRQRDSQFKKIFQPNRKVVFLKIHHRGTLVESPLEASLIGHLVCDLLSHGFSPTEIAVIAPYRRQNNLIKSALKQVASLYKKDLDFSDVIVDTVERMQGQERELILVSLTVSEEGLMNQDGDFLFNPNRFNVVLTRAKTKLVVVGSPQFFRYLPLSGKIKTHNQVPSALPPLPIYLRKGQKEALSEGKSALEKANLFKKWYFERKEKGEILDYTQQTYRFYEELLAKNLR